MGRAMKEVNKYRLYCSTEEEWKHVIKESGESAPSACPDDTSHTIDSSSIKIIDTLTINDFNSRESLSKGGPSLAVRGFQGTAPANSEESFDYDVSEDLALKEGILHILEGTYDKKSVVGAEIIDKNNLLGYGENSSIHKYGENVNLDPNTDTAGLKNKALTELNFNGLTIRVHFNNKSSESVTFGVNMIFYTLD